MFAGIDFIYVKIRKLINAMDIGVRVNIFLKIIYLIHTCAYKELKYVDNLSFRVKKFNKCIIYN